MKHCIFFCTLLWSTLVVADARSFIRSELAKMGRAQSQVRLFLSDDFSSEKTAPLFSRRRAVTIRVSWPGRSDDIVTISKTVHLSLFFPQKYLVRLHFAGEQDFSFELDEKQMDEPFEMIQSIVPLFAGQVEGQRLRESQWRTFRTAIHAIMEALQSLPEEEIVEAWL